MPGSAIGVVIFAHSSGSRRLSPRNVAVACAFNQGGLATLLFDLLSPAEAVDRANVFDIGLLSERLAQATAWLQEQPEAADLAVGYFGASTGAAAALLAATRLLRGADRHRWERSGVTHRLTRQGLGLGQG